MTFIRFAGCNVGQRLTNNDKTVPIFHDAAAYQEKCQTALGETFLCDTNYRMSQRMTIAEIVAALTPQVPTVLLTGGEPLMHDLQPLLTAIALDNAQNVHRRRIHIETSGTKPLLPLVDSLIDWVTVSPKRGCLDQLLLDADEIKFLVGDMFDTLTFEAQYYSKYGDKIFLQPVNDERTLNQSNIQRCLTLQKVFPKVRISTQLHKVWGVR